MLTVLPIAFFNSWQKSDIFRQSVLARNRDIVFQFDHIWILLNDYNGEPQFLEFVLQ